jgi:predicted nucleic acid-binding protein
MEITPGEILFLDTNILLTATDESRAHHVLARNMIASHQRIGLHLGISGQIIREYLVVATRAPEVNGLGMEPAEAIKNVQAFNERLLFFDETEAGSIRLRHLTNGYQLIGTRIHDANVVATMLSHGLSKLVTENRADFSVFSEVKTIALPEFHQFMSGAD